MELAHVRDMFVLAPVISAVSACAVRSDRHLGDERRWAAHAGLCSTKKRGGEVAGRLEESAARGMLHVMLNACLFLYTCPPNGRDMALVCVREVVRRGLGGGAERQASLV